MTGLTRYGLAGDVRGFYARIGVTLPPKSTREATTRCFVDVGAHRRGDRAASCSVNIASGAFYCHACGARGGAYDAAIALGYSPREAIDLMVDFGLTERRSGRGTRIGTPTPARSAPTLGLRHPAADLPTTERDIRRWAARLAGDLPLLARLRRERAWAEHVLRKHDIGWDGSRVIVPVRRAGMLAAVLRYAPESSRRGPKMLAIAGSRQGLFPEPSCLSDARTVWLVEGPPDALAALSSGIPAVSVPGAHAWTPAWAEQLTGLDVVVCLDCDRAGREAAQRIASDLRQTASSVRLLDLEPGRIDGYDITDAILGGGLTAGDAST